MKLFRRHARNLGANSAPPVENALWPQRLRWFLAEITVVVAGILLALGLQSWWQDRENQSRGDAYQRQILSDVRQTRATYEKAIANDRELRAATARLSDALSSKQSLQGDEALQWLRWRSGWFSDPRPVTGNVYSLIDTGEIQLIRNPEIRAAIIDYASIMKGGSADSDGQVGRMQRANDLELLRLEEAGLPPLPRDISDIGKYDTEQLKDILPQYMAAWPKLRNDPQYRTVQNLRLLAYDNMTAYNQEMFAATERLKALLEADEKVNAH